MAKLRIGEVAARAGVSVDTVRYDERVGVLPKAARRVSGYRVFDETTVERIELVKQLQALSLPLDEVAAMLSSVTTCKRESSRIESALRRTNCRAERRDFVERASRSGPVDRSL